MSKAIIPAFLPQFQCDGQRCPDNCCLGSWTIHVDELHYRRMKKITDVEIKPVVDRYVKRNRQSRGSQDFGKLVQDPKLGRCAFLTEDRLCRLQAKMGPDTLCNVCMLYPRVTTEIVGHPLERTLTLSCPLAAELALLDPESMQFLEVDLDLGGRNMISVTFDPYTDRHKFPEKAHILSLREFTIQVLKSRDLALWQRLVILGIFFGRIQSVIDAGESASIPAEIQKYRQLIVNERLADSLHDIALDASLQVKLVRELMTQKIMEGVNPDVTQIFVDAMTGFGFDVNEDDAENARRYQEVRASWYEPFMLGREYILENYLVNQVFSTVFPGNRPRPLASYALLAVQYAMIKVMLVGQAGYLKEAFDEACIVRVIQKFTKSIMHNPKFLQKIHDQLERNGLLTMAHTAILVRN